MRLLLALLFFVLLISSFAVRDDNKIFPEKILLIKIDKGGQISVGRDTISSDEVAPYVQDRLLKSYMGTGNMHDRIVLEKTDPDVPDVITEVLVKEIKEGQRRALTAMCLQKHKKLFADLSIKHQDKLKKQYPVLFQTTYI